ncbi:MAG TPA: nucleotide sugar dehydrogenase [Streptosporangiaceae bacterium]|nr:nucleotide sugar dehydrogenase [Streptosporangiaceae bacterium]
MAGRGLNDRVSFACDVVIVGGCGHAGLPLAVAFAGRGARVISCDSSTAAVDAVNAGRLPFHEPAAELPLQRAVSSGRLVASADPAVIAAGEHVVLIVDDSDGPSRGRPDALLMALDECSDEFRDGQVLILRSTAAPGTTATAEKFVARLGIDVDVAFCPERTVQGMAMTELYELPQIVASRSASGLERASRLFSMLTAELVPMTVEEAELAKLFTNAWRYIKFAAANQFYMIAADLGLDYERIRQGLERNYPRGRDMAKAGLAAGPCLLHDAAGLARSNAGFTLGRSAIAVNQGLPGYLVSRIELAYDLPAMTVGVLGMAFKGGSDDTRSSLAYLLADLLAAKAREVLCTDPLVTTDPDLLPLQEVLSRADLLVIGAPHPHYRDLRTELPVVDIWNLRRQGVLI